MKVTQDNLNDLLETGMSFNGAWNRAQLEAILPKHEFIGSGTWSIRKGWKDRLIGKELSQEQIDTFLAAKNRHLRFKRQFRPKQPELWTKTEACLI